MEHKDMLLGWAASDSERARDYAAASRRFYASGETTFARKWLALACSCTETCWRWREQSEVAL